MRADGNLSVRALARPGLMPVSFTLEAGRCLAVIGPSGAGKSLLLRALADLDPNAGGVTLGGLARAAVPAPEWRRRVGYLAAEPGWWAERAEEHFAKPARAREAMPELMLAPALLERPVAELSTGERQRLALLRLLENEPAVLLLDEPTAALDAASAACVEKRLRALLAEGRIVVLVTHDPDLPARLGARRARMAHGRFTLEEEGA